MDAQLRSPLPTSEGVTLVPPLCPFFRSVEVDGALRAPIEAPDGANRCAAFGPPRRQSALQQELVCLTTGHTDCPRYMQGVARVREAAIRRERLRRLARPMTGAIAFLVLSAAASFSFVITRGGLTLPEGRVAGLSETPEPAVAAAPTASPAEPTAAPTVPPSLEPSVAPTAPPSTEPSVAPTPSPTPRPTPSSTPSASPTPEFDGLEPCPGEPGCFLYTVVSGDNLWDIGQRYGHSLDTVREWNPWTREQGLRPGAELRLPTPNT
jgi:hypothetical protein